MSKSFKKILIAAGHSAADSGAVSGAAIEAKLALDLRDLIVSEFLPTEPFEVTTDGVIGQNLPLKDSIFLAHGKDVAVEIHFNAAANPQATGVEVIAPNNKRVAAQRLAAGISACLGLKLRGDSGWIDQSQSARGKLGFVSAGGFILEICFISNIDDLKAYASKKKLLATVLAKLIKEI